MNKLTFRKATEADVTSIFDLYTDARKAGKETGSCDWSEDYPNIEILHSDIQNMCIYLAEENSQIIGAFTILETDDLDNEPLQWKPVKSCVPVRICISPEKQGKGLGKEIVQEIIEISKDDGYQSLRLLASIHNIPAIKLYQRIGFKNKGKISLYNNEYYAYEYVMA